MSNVTTKPVGGTAAIRLGERVAFGAEDNVALAEETPGPERPGVLRGGSNAARFGDYR